MFTTWGKNNHNWYMLINTRPHADSYILLIYHTREEGSRVKWSLWSGIFSRISRAFSRLLFVCCTLHLSFQGHYIYNSELSLDTVTRNADRQLRCVAASIPFIRKHQVSVHKFRFFLASLGQRMSNSSTISKHSVRTTPEFQFTVLRVQFRR